MTSTGRIICAEAETVLPRLPAESVALIYADPPFNTGNARRGGRITAQRSDTGRTGFAGHSYLTTRHDGPSYADTYDDYMGWLVPLLEESHRVLRQDGTLYLHVDPREAHYCKVALDRIFGRECFLNELIWAYDFGGRGSRRWAAKHDTILVYVRDPKRYHFDPSDVDRIPYLAPGLQTPERARAGKLPTDVWWQTIVPTAGSERTGYPTQKPLTILRRIVSASSRRGDLVLDWCAGSGTTGVACRELGRDSLLVDRSPDAVAVMTQRLAGYARVLPVTEVA